MERRREGRKKEAIVLSGMAPARSGELGVESGMLGMLGVRWLTGRFRRRPSLAKKTEVRTPNQAPGKHHRTVVLRNVGDSLCNKGNPG